MQKGFRRIILIMLFLIFIGLASIYFVRAAGDIFALSSLMFAYYGGLGAFAAILVFVLILTAGGYLVWTSRRKDNADTVVKRRKKK